MNRSDIIKEISSQIDTPKSVVAIFMDALASQIRGAIKNGEPVEINGLLRIKVEHKPARIGRNPSTGAAIEIPAKNVVKITPAKALTDAANK